MKAGWVWLVLLLVSLQALSQESLDALDGRLAELGRARQWTRALPLAEQMVELARRTKGPESPELATCLNNLGAVQSQVEQNPQAVENLRAAVRIREKALGPDHLLTALALYSLGNVYQAMRDYARAEDALLRCLSIRELRLGPNHPDTRATLQHLAVAARERGDFLHEQEYSERLGHTPVPSSDVFLASLHDAPLAPSGPPAATPSAGGLSLAQDPMQQRMAIDEYQLARTWEEHQDYAGAANHYQKCLLHAIPAYTDLPRANFGGRPLAAVARRALELNLTMLRAGGPARLIFPIHQLYRQLEVLEPDDPSWFYLDAVVWASAGNYLQSNRLLDKIEGQGSARLQSKVHSLKSKIGDQVTAQRQLSAQEMAGFKSVYEAGAWLPAGSNTKTRQPDWQRRASLAQAQKDEAAANRLQNGGATCADLEKYP